MLTIINKILPNIVSTLAAIGLTLAVLHFGNCGSIQDKANNNYTANCFSYVMALTKAERYHGAAVAHCLCQQSAKRSDQNMCQQGVRVQNIESIISYCQSVKEYIKFEACQAFFPNKGF